MTTPVSAATPASAIIPIQTATERLYPNAQRSHTLPTSAKGSDAITIRLSATLRKLR